jgi:hypothetical protein
MQPDKDPVREVMLLGILFWLITFVIFTVLTN